MSDRADEALRQVRRWAKQGWRATSKHLPPRVAEGIRAPTKRLLRSIGLVSKP